MTSLSAAVAEILDVQKKSGKPLAIIVAGHNGSGKSTLWYERLAPELRIPLINADRMMLSILPEATGPKRKLPEWARALRDEDEGWMRVAQQSVLGFVAQALANKVPFAVETVFSHWKKRPDGTVDSKIDQIRQIQAAGYFVVLIFVGLTDDRLSIARVITRVAKGGHAVAIDKLQARFPRTQMAIRAAAAVADAAILTDNSRSFDQAFTVCRVQIGEKRIYDCRETDPHTPPEILAWLKIVAPHPPG